jgi:hypothetical protein
MTRRGSSFSFDLLDEHLRTHSTHLRRIVTNDCKWGRHLTRHGHVVERH